MNHFDYFKLSSILAEIPSQEFWVAYSGGMDSHVLLHGLVQVRVTYPVIKITAIHINHTLSANADLWDKHCRKVCEELQVNYLSKKIDVPGKLAKKQSMEAVARKLRYEVFADCLPAGACLLTAHHADDQAETILLQLLRGAGVKGLAGIAAKTSFGKGWLVRPLLNFSRQDLLTYAKEQQLQWIEDESNLDFSINRNYLRHKIMPLFTERWLGAVKSFGQAAKNAVDANELLDVLAAEDYLNLQGNAANTLSITKLLQLSAARQRNVLRYWLKELNLPIPSSIKLEHIQKDVLHCQAGANPLVHWHGAEVRRYLDNIYALPPLVPFNATQEFIWDLQSDLVLPNLGILRATGQKNIAPVVVKFRNGGERCQPKGRKETHLLSKLFQEWKVPPWQRDRIPLIYCDCHLMVVVGYCICEGWNEKEIINLRLFFYENTYK